MPLVVVETLRDQAETLFCCQGRRDEIFRSNAKYHKFWNVIRRNDAKLTGEEKRKVELERSFLSRHIHKYLRILDSILASGEEGEGRGRGEGVG